MSKASIRRHAHPRHQQHRRLQRIERHIASHGEIQSSFLMSLKLEGSIPILDVSDIVDAQLKAEDHAPPQDPAKKMGKPGYAYGSETMLAFLVAVSAKLKARDYDFDPDEAFADAALDMTLHDLKLAIVGKIKP